MFQDFYEALAQENELRETEQKLLDDYTQIFIQELAHIKSMDDTQFNGYIASQEDLIRAKPCEIFSGNYANTQTEGFDIVSMDGIIGSFSPAFERGWVDTEYQTRKGRHQQIWNKVRQALRVSEERVGEVIDELFHITDGDRLSRVILYKWEPDDERYYAFEGNNRIASLLILGLKSIPAEIERMQKI